MASEEGLQSVCVTEGQQRQAALRLLWNEMCADPTAEFFWNDWAPTSFDGFVVYVEGCKAAWLVPGHGMPAGIIMLGSAICDPHSGRVLHGALEVYMRPGYRGKFAAQAVRSAMAALEGMGCVQVFAWPQRRNRASCHMLGYLGWLRVGLVPAFILSGGQFHDAVLYVWRGTSPCRLPR